MPTEAKSSPCYQHSAQKEKTLRLINEKNVNLKRETSFQGHVGLKSSDSNSSLKLKYLKENLENLKVQNALSSDFNKKTRVLLNSLSKINEENKSDNNQRLMSTSYSSYLPGTQKHFQMVKSKSNHLGQKYSQSFYNRPEFAKSDIMNRMSTNSSNISKINSDLINYVRLREKYMQHANYWQQTWLFTDNPIYEYGNQCFKFKDNFGLDENQDIPFSMFENYSKNLL